MTGRATRLIAGACCVMLTCSGCGILTTRAPELANAETGDDDQALLLDDIQEITADMTTTDAEKRTALRDLGILDEDLIDALLTF